VNISGHTKPYAVLGHPIGHTLSPVMHNAAFKALGMDAIYLAFDVDPSNLMRVLPAMANMGFGGVNLTVPLKQTAFKGLKNMDDSAHALGAVNTVEFLPHGMKGHNTDGTGFLSAIKEAFHTEVAGLSVFVLGCGGAGRAIAITCALTGAKRITVADIEPDRAKRVAKETRRIARSCDVCVVPASPQLWRKACVEADLVVQATPIGMKQGDNALLPPSAFHAGQMVFDLVYMYPETAFMKAARKDGAKTSNGLGMLLHQGACAFTIWTGRRPPTDIMRKALEKMVYPRQTTTKTHRHNKT
jgi:shikimate dehydrogenase